LGNTHNEFVTYSPQSLSDCNAALQAVLNLCKWWGNQAPPAFLREYSQSNSQGNTRITLEFEECDDHD
jgi:hypothetical protein